MSTANFQIGEMLGIILYTDNYIYQPTLTIQIQTIDSRASPFIEILFIKQTN